MTTNPNRTPFEKANLLADAYKNLAVAAAKLYEAGSLEDMFHCHTVMDMIQGDHAELLKTHFPVVENKT